MKQFWFWVFYVEFMSKAEAVAEFEAEAGAEVVLLA